MDDEDSERRKARKKTRWSKGAPGKPRKIVNAGPAHGACTAGVYYAVYKEDASGADIIVCVHSAEQSFVSIGASASGVVQSESLIRRGEAARQETVREARSKGLLREN
jgi:hypothetical protein